MRGGRKGGGGVSTARDSRSRSLQRMVRRSVELMLIHQETKVTRRDGKGTLKQTQTIRHHSSLKTIDEALLVEECQRHLPGCSVVRIVIIAGDKYGKMPTK